jgi:hypothetical protein
MATLADLSVSPDLSKVAAVAVETMAAFKS